MLDYSETDWLGYEEFKRDIKMHEHPKPEHMTAAEGCLFFGAILCYLAVWVGLIAFGVIALERWLR